MIEFLKEANISDDIIDLIKQNNSDNAIYTLYCNQDECMKIISYFHKIGINSINELLINEIEIFYKIASDVIKEFSKYDINALVNVLNKNYHIIEEII